MSELNLLNPTERNKANKIKTYFAIKHVLLQVVSLLLMITTIFYFSSIILKNNSDSLDEQIAKEIEIRQQGNVNSIEDATKLLNSQLELVKNIQDKHVYWTIFLNDFSELVPDNITINNLEFYTNILSGSNTRTFKISGIANARQDFINFESNLTNSEYYSEINAPLSNLIQKENINFVITGILSNEI
ncbi:MAG: hypothetical protein Q8P20_02860 [bacterium]|nr:hypothetical protein [bacterium]